MSSRLVPRLLGLLLLMYTHAAAQWTDIGSLIGSGALPGGAIVYPLRSSDGRTQINIGLTPGELKDAGFNTITVSTFKFTGTFTDPELRLFASHISKVASTCFNTDASRAPVISAWVLSNETQETSLFHTAGTRLAEQDFGPLHLQLEKRMNGKGHVVQVNMSRKGTPGQAPWSKSCGASG